MSTYREQARCRSVGLKTLSNSVLQTACPDPPKGVDILTRIDLIEASIAGAERAVLVEAKE
jgi:hypothetical protein